MNIQQDIKLYYNASLNMFLNRYFTSILFNWRINSIKAREKPIRHGDRSQISLLP